MQENEFEKQVKHKLEGFHLSPSAPVWEAIKKQIEKKKRRIVPFILLLCGIIISAGLFMYADMHNNINRSGKNHTSADSIKNQNAQSSVTLQQDNNKQNISGASNLKDQHLPALKNENKIKYNSSIFIVNNHQSSAIKNRINNQQIENNNLKNGKPTIAYQPIIKQNISADTSVYKNQFTNTETEKQHKQVASAQINVQGDSGKIISNINIDSSSKINNQTANIDSSKQNKKPTVKKNNKSTNWQLGVIAMYGRSNLNDNLFNTGLSTSKAFDQGSVPATLNGNVSTGQKQPYNTNDAYEFGITIQKRFFSKSYVSTGLKYIHLSNKSTTVRNLDSSLIAVSPYFLNNLSYNGYYRYGSEKTYTNTFSFIEIPLSFQSNFFHIRQFAVSYDAGISVMQLLSATSLLYDSKNNNFFSDNDLLRRTQFQLLAGLNLQLNTKNNGCFLLGPHLEYSLSTFLKNKDYNHLHFINYGLQALWLFNKK